MTIAYLVTCILLASLLFLVFGTLLSLSSNPHWFVRGWDFPRVQIVVIGLMLAAIYGGIRATAGVENVVSAWPFWTLAIALTLWHGFRIMPYTRLLSKQSADTRADLVADHLEDDATVRMVMSNVEMENNQYEQWMQTMRLVDPDLLLIVEIDESWVDGIADFIDEYPHRVIEARDNWYGMMMLSRLPIDRFEVRHLVQEDIPSIDAYVRLNNNTLIRFIGVHPRPPEPIRDTDAIARDAELTLWGQELADEQGPVIIGGDLNDVAWSQTTRLFLRVSGMLDPRRGRGFFNSFHADHWFMRFPLDHIFHSTHFTVSKIQRMQHVGSDHFPIMIDLRYSPTENSEHEVLEKKEGDDEEIRTRLDRADEDETSKGEAFDGDPSNGEREVSSKGT
jgi:endonuclease/exonuclease/phosphatase (EEP) superfamily protein YafD